MPVWRASRRFPPHEHSQNGILDQIETIRWQRPSPRSILTASRRAVRLRLDYVLVFAPPSLSRESTSADDGVIQVADCAVRPCRDEGKPLSDHDGVKVQMAIEREASIPPNSAR